MLIVFFFFCFVSCPVYKWWWCCCECESKKEKWTNEKKVESKIDYCFMTENRFFFFFGSVCVCVSCRQRLRGCSSCFTSTHSTSTSTTVLKVFNWMWSRIACKKEQKSFHRSQEKEKIYHVFPSIPIWCIIPTLSHHFSVSSIGAATTVVVVFCFVFKSLLVLLLFTIRKTFHLRLYKVCLKAFYIALRIISEPSTMHVIKEQQRSEAEPIYHSNHNYRSCNFRRIEFPFACVMANTDSFLSISLSVGWCIGYTCVRACVRLVYVCLFVVYQFNTCLYWIPQHQQQQQQ